MTPQDQKEAAAPRGHMEVQDQQFSRLSELCTCTQWGSSVTVMDFVQLEELAQSGLQAALAKTMGCV